MTSVKKVWLSSTLGSIIFHNQFLYLKMTKRPLQNDSSQDNGKKQKTAGHWSQGLELSIEDPNCLVKSDDLVHVIKDKYPKAKYHYLVIPKEDINNMQSLRSKHVELLKHMEDVAHELVGEDQHKGSKFKIGFHSEPSMSRLHLHVISNDMISDCVKTKKHWNSYTTDFFIPAKDIIDNLEKNEKVILPTKEMLKKFMDAPIKCHKCDYKPKHMPDLKRHILTHENE